MWILRLFVSTSSTACGSCIWSVFYVPEKDMPKCDTVVHVKRAACGCGHKFALKRKGRRSVENESVKRRRAVECEEVVMQRKDKERVRKVRERAGEMPEKTLEATAGQNL